MKRKVYKARNGATLLYLKDKRKDYSAVFAGFMAGHMANTQNGLAHFFEHMMFKQIKGHSQDDYANMKMEIIPTLNGHTNCNGLCIDWIRSNKLFNEAMELTGKILTETDLTDENVEKERGVIEEEYRVAKRRETRDMKSALTNLASSIANVATPESCCGTHEDLEKINVAVLEKFREDNFCTNNFVMGYVGNLSARKVKKVLKKYILDKLEEKPNYEIKKFMPEVDKEPALSIVTNDDKSIKFEISFDCGISVEQRENSFYHRWLARYFNRNNHVFYKALRNKGLIYVGNACISNFGEKTLFKLYGETGKDKLLMVLKEINSSIRTAIHEGIKDEEVELYKKNRKLKEDETLSLKSKYEKCGAMVKEFTSSIDGKFKEKKSAKYYDKIADQTTAQMINDFAKQMFNENNKPFIIIMGDITKEEVPTHEQICNAIYKDLDKPLNATVPENNPQTSADVIFKDETKKSTALTTNQASSNQNKPTSSQDDFIEDEEEREL